VVIEARRPAGRPVGAKDRRPRKKPQGRRCSTRKTSALRRRCSIPAGTVCARTARFPGQPDFQRFPALTAPPGPEGRAHLVGDATSATGPGRVVLTPPATRSNH
jgi:hypothetical protein